MPQEPVLLDGPALAHALGVDPALVRKWAQRGKLTRKGTDGRGRALYDYAEALKVHAEMRRRRPYGVKHPGQAVPYPRDRVIGCTSSFGPTRSS